MSTVIIRGFEFSKDFRSVSWGATIRYNVLRSFFSGLVWPLIMALSGIGNELEGAMLTLFPFLWPFVYLVFFLPVGVLCVWIAPALNIAIWVAFLMAVFAVALGDPFVCLLKRFRPSWVPVEEPPLFSLKLIMFVLAAPEVAVATNGRYVS